MMIKIRKGLILQQSPKHPGLFRRFLHGNQVLNLTEGHHPLDPVLWASVLEDSKLSGVLGIQGWVVWIHEDLQLDPVRLVHISPINLVHLFTLETKGMEGEVLKHRRRKSSGRFRKITHGHFLD
jgi:hypothetical protein